MFHPYSFYLQKHKNAKIKRESALPFFSFPLLLHLVIHTPNAPNRLLLCPISPFGVSHFTIWDIPFCLLGIPFHHLGCPISPFGMSHFTIWGIPFHHLGYRISPFGVSHFAFWGISFHHLGCPILPFGMSHFTVWGIFWHICPQPTAPMPDLPSSFFRCQICEFFFVCWEN